MYGGVILMYGGATTGGTGRPKLKPITTPALAGIANPVANPTTANPSNSRLFILYFRRVHISRVQKRSRLHAPAPIPSICRVDTRLEIINLSDPAPSRQSAALWRQHTSLPGTSWHWSAHVRQHSRSRWSGRFARRNRNRLLQNELVSMIPER